MPLIAVAANNAWNIVNFRTGLIAALKREGYDVAVIAPAGPYADAVRALGVDFHAVTLDPRGVSPLRDLGLLGQYRAIFRRIRPAAKLGFTAKPNIWGTLAARLSGVKAINNISGLGTAFIRGGPLKAVVSMLYRIALSSSDVVFFQNAADRELFVEAKLVDPAKVRMLPGSGIDLERFTPGKRRPPRKGGLIFLMPARLIRDKGVREYAEAARTLKQRHPKTRFQLLGFFDEGREAIPKNEVEIWVADGIIDYLGSTDDIRTAFAEADVIVLPSYREGTPRALLEAAAMGIPSVTTDAPGCREVVDDGVTGFLCDVRSAGSLAEAMERMIGLSAPERAAMGAAARRRAEKIFDETLVHGAYIDALRQTEIATRPNV